MPRRIERVFVWIGAGLFAVSLAVTTWSYARAFVRTNGPLNIAAAGIDVLLLTGFALHHSLFARTAMKTVLSRHVPPHLVRACYVCVASLLLIGVCLLWQPVGGQFYRWAGPAQLLFVALQAVGLALIVGAARAIRVRELAGIDPPRPRADELQVRGPYAFVRHPLYLGWVLAIGGTSHMTGDRLIFFLATTAYIALAIPWEEHGLVEEFGPAYERYRGQVRWRVIPFVY